MKKAKYTERNPGWKEVTGKKEKKAGRKKKLLDKPIMMRYHNKAACEEL